MLDFGLGGYGIADGMRKEQDRITQNRTTFSNNIANFLANNPYLSPEAVQAYVNAAAGTDNTLRGVIPNQLIGEFNQENSRKRRIDTFKAFNEFTRLNPGATAAEFQSAISALGAQGIYGEDALKAIQGRADQYRKDQETARQMKLAQDIGNTRNSMMSDIEFQAAALGYDPVKVTQSLRGIYGDNPPIPYESLINPGSMEVMRTKTIQQYLPEAVKILEANPDLPMELLDGAFPALRGSPIIKSIYEAAQEKRREAIENRFYSLENRKRVVDAVTNAYSMGLDPQTTLTESLRGIGIRPEDMSGLDTSSIMTEAKASSDKIKADKDLEKRTNQAKAAANITTSLAAMTSNEVDAARFASMSDAQLEQEIRRLVASRSGLIEEEIAELPAAWYADIVSTIRSDLNTRALTAQQQRYDAARGMETTISDAIRKDSTESAKNATSEEALTFLGLKDAASGGGIQAAVRDLATRYDMSNGRAGTAINLAIDILDKDPNAAANITMALEKDVRFQQMFRPINKEAQEQATNARIRDGSDRPAPIGFTPWVKQEAAQIRKESEGYLADINGIMSANQSPDAKLEALKTFANTFGNDIANAANAYQMRQESQHRWTSANDRWNDDAFSAVRIELQALQARVQTELNRAQAQLQREVEKQRTANMEPGRILEDPVDRSRSGLYNTLTGIVPNEARQKYDVIAGELSRYELGGSPLGFIYKSVEDQELYRSIADLAYSPEAITFLLQRPDLYALIDSNSPTVDPKRFIQEFNKAYRPSRPQ